MHAEYDSDIRAVRCGLRGAARKINLNFKLKALDELREV